MTETPPSPGPRPRFVVVGDVLTDVVAVLAQPLATGSDTPAGIRFTGGGQGANTAAWLAWAGNPVTLVGAVGDDEPGRARLAELARHGVDCAVRRCADAPTGTVIVLAHDGDRTMVTQRGANLRLTAADVRTAVSDAPDARHLHLSGYTLLDAGSRQAGHAALAAARRRGLTVSVDAASARPLRQAGARAFLDWVRGVDLLLANADEAAVLARGAARLGYKTAGPGCTTAGRTAETTGPPARTTGPDSGRHAESAARALTAVVRHVVVKQGSEGAIWADGAGLVRSAARPVPMVDPTGAGDAFAAGLLTAWLAGADPPAALRLGGELGAVAVSTVGARPAID